MKHIQNHILYIGIILLLLGITGCRKHYPVAEKLLQAEAVMNEHPDSALNLLKGIAQPELQTREHHARYALLYSQALDKNYIDLTNDSLINIAVDYYKDRDDVRAKFLSYYYQGRIYTNANNLTQATLAYMEAEQLVDELGDDYAAGLLYTQMGVIYENYYDYPKALESYLHATEHYHKADKPLHKLYGMLSQSAIYKSMKKETDSFHILYNTLMEAKETNQASVVYSCLGDLIMLCLDMDKQKEAVSFYNELINHYSIERMTPSFYASLGLLMAKEKNIEKSQLYINKAWERARTQSDSIHLYYISSQVEQLFSSYQKAYSDLKQSVTLQNNSVREALQQPVLTAQKNFLKQELQHKEYRFKMEKYIRLLGFTILLLVSILAILLLRKKLLRNYQKSLKEKLEERDCAHEEKIKALQQEALKREDSLRSHAAQLEARATLSKEDIERLKKELDESKMHIEEARKFREQHQQETDLLKSDNHDALLRINKTLKNHFKQIENTYQVLLVKYKTADNRDKAIEEYIQNTTAEFYGSKKADRNLEKLVNELYGDAMCQLRKEIKLPSEEHYRLACLLLAGLSVNFIATLTGETTNAIYKRRDKIRENIKDSEDICKELCLFLKIII